MTSMARTFGYKSVLVVALVSSLLRADLVAQDSYAIDCTIPQSWVQAEYLMGWIKEGPNGVPLISRGNSSDPRPAALGQPGTTVLAGGSPIDFGTLEGGRLTFGRWRDSSQTIGWELSAFYMEQGDLSSSFASQEGDPEVVTAPIQLPDGSESSISALVNAPGAPSPFETLTTRYQSRLAGGQANLVSNSFRSCCASWDTLLGFRLLNLEESTSLNADISRTVAGGRARTFGEDLFETDATFYGTSLGWRGERYGRRWVLSGKTGFSLGLTENRVEVSGYRTQINPGVTPVTTPGFVFA
ncbi:MAG: BBP7 family outer membrane beta-barrel protein, partial [Pirellulaceae bacterium]